MYSVMWPLQVSSKVFPIFSYQGKITQTAKEQKKHTFIYDCVSLLDISYFLTVFLCATPLLN